MARMNTNTLGSLGIGIIVLIYLSSALQLPFGSLNSPGEGFMPVVASIIILAICLYGFLKEFLFPTGKPLKKIMVEGEATPEDRINSKRPFKIMIAIIVYPLALVNVGFIISTVALLFVTLSLIGVFCRHLGGSIARHWSDRCHGYAYGSHLQRISLP